MDKDQALQLLKEMIQVKVEASHDAPPKARARLQQDIEALLYGVWSLNNEDAMPDTATVIGAWTSLKPWQRQS